MRNCSVCLIAVGQSVDEIEQLFCLPAEQVYMFRKSVCWKMRLEEEKLLGDKLREILKDNSCCSAKIPILAAKNRTK